MSSRLERKAPNGKYVVCVWDAVRPSRSTRFASAPYSVKNFAVSYAKSQNKRLEDQVTSADDWSAPYIGEPEYFVIDDQGNRV